LKKWKGATIKQFAKLMEPYRLEVADLAQACLGLKQFLQIKN
jgi:hypothetical protein